MSRPEKNATLFYFSIAVAMTMLVAAGLPALRFDPGKPLPEVGGTAERPTLSQGDKSVALPVNKIVVAIMLACFASILVYSAIRLIMGVNWRDLRFWLLKAHIACIGVTTFLYFILLSFPRGTILPKAEAPPIPPRVSVEPSAIGSPPAAIVWLVAFAALGIAIALVYGLLLPKRDSGETRSHIEMEAAAARQALLEGRNFKDVITGCYRRMSRDLERERGIERQDSMTAREFEALLGEGGVPAESVHRLTLLFEAVRYGNSMPSALDESEALRCLEAIEGYSWKGKAQS
jgi:hypothetical protein